MMTWMARRWFLSIVVFDNLMFAEFVMGIGWMAAVHSVEFLQLAKALVDLWEGVHQRYAENCSMETRQDKALENYNAGAEEELWARDLSHYIGGVELFEAIDSSGLEHRIGEQCKQMMTAGMYQRPGSVRFGLLIFYQFQ